MIRKKRIYPWAKLLTLLFLGLFIIAPLTFVLLTAFDVDGKFDLMLPIELIVTSKLHRVILNTILLGLLVVIGTTVLALPFAFLVVKTQLGKWRFLDVLLIIPFMTPPYINSMGWMLFMQKRGFLEQLVPMAESITPYFFSLFGMVLIMSLHLFPFLYLILKNALIKIGGQYEEAGAIFGGSHSYRLRRILIPLLLSSYMMGSLLIFVKTIAEFGTPATFGRKIGFHVMTSEIHRFVSYWPIDFGKAATFSSILLGTCMLFWYIQNILSRKYNYATVGGKGIRGGAKQITGWKRLIALIYVSTVIILAIGIPYFSIIVASLQKLRGKGLTGGNFTLNHYKELLHIDSPGMHALLNSLGLAIVTATIVVGIGLLLSLQIRRARRVSEKAIDIIGILPNTVPAIVIIVGLILLWNASWMPVPLYNSYGFVVLVYSVLFLPYAIQYTKASYGQIDESLMHAGQVFGGTYLYNFRRILLPLIVPGILAGWIMVFTISIRELVASLMILPPSMEVSSTYIFSQFEQGDVSLGMAMAVISVGLTTIVLTIMNQKVY